MLRSDKGPMDRKLTVHEQHELRVLELVEERDRITQRGVATELEIAVGMANALIKRLVHKGYIKVKNAPSRRYKYYITPEGFLEKGQGELFFRKGKIGTWKTEVSPNIINKIEKLFKNEMKELGYL